MLVLSLNVRGLGGVDKRRLVRKTILSCNPDVVLLQETKKEELPCWFIRWILGPDLSEWCLILAVGTVGGVLCAWNPSLVNRIDEVVRRFSISILFKDVGVGDEWLFTRVYGSASMVNREDFWVELKGFREGCGGPWMVGGTSM